METTNAKCKNCGSAKCQLYRKNGKPYFPAGLCQACYVRKRKYGDVNFYKRTNKGDSQTPEYRAWINMRARCENKKHPRYPDYGGRGIVVAERWLGKDGFKNFLNDVGRRPRGCSLDRIDNESNYSPDNCRWATAKQQANNRRARKKSVGDH